MMNKLYVCNYTGNGPSDQLKAIRAVRNALFSVGHERVGIARPREIIDEVMQNDVALVAEHEDEQHLYNIAQKIYEDAPGLISTLVNPSPQVIEYCAGNNVEENSDEAEDDNISPYRTAMVLLVMTNGNVLSAAAHATQLGNAASDEEFYGEVVQAIVDTFPWVVEILVANGLVEKED